jgi:Phosphoribosyl-ATP pyrophosphohydrolase
MTIDMTVDISQWTTIWASQYSRVADFAIESGYKRDPGGFADEKRRKLGAHMIFEEFNELLDAIEKRSKLEWIDAVADLIYVVYFAYFMWGVEPEFSVTDRDVGSARSQIETIQTFVQSDVAPDLSTLNSMLNNILNYIYSGGLPKIEGEECSTDVISRAFDLVHTSNMSKFTASEEVAKRTVEAYTEAGVYDTPNYYRGATSFVIKNTSTGKILKSIEYVDAPSLFHRDPLVSSWLSGSGSGLGSGLRSGLGSGFGSGLMQNALDMPPALRTNVDFVFILRGGETIDRKLLYEQYAGMFPDFESFCQVLDQCRRPGDASL